MNLIYKWDPILDIKIMCTVITLLNPLKDTLLTIGLYFGSILLLHPKPWSPFLHSLSSPRNK